MNAIRNRYAYVLKSIKKDKSLLPLVSNLDGKTYLISGGTRGIGLDIGKKLSKLGANVAILGKTVKEHPKLEGTIYSAQQEIKNCYNGIHDYNNSLGVPCDVRNEDEVESAVEKVLDEFGGIDGVVLNASALCLNNTINQTRKELDLMTGVNIMGTFTVGQKVMPHLKNSELPHALIIAPPLSMLDDDDWWVNHMYYSMSKYNMSLMAKFWNKEFKGVAVNTLWPRTTIDTAPVRNILGGDEMSQISRKTDIMGVAASSILMSDPLLCNGKQFIDDEVLASLDIDVEKFKVNKDVSEKELMPGFFC